MDKNLFSIGEIAKLKNITIKALRFYDKIGLLKPYFVDPYTSYRYYHIKQFIYLDIIKAARNMDISPNVLIPYFEKKDCDGLIKLINQHKTKLYEKINTIQNVIEGIENVTNTINILDYVDKNGDVYTRTINTRHVITTPYSLNKNPHDILIDYSNLDVLISNRKLINTYEAGTYYSQSKSENTFMPEYIFSCISREVDTLDYKLIPGGDFVCVLCNKDTAEEQVGKLTQHIEKHNLKPMFFVQTEILTNFFEEESMYFEMQVKI